MSTLEGDMKENYDKAFEFIMRWEGYKSDDPDDSGGRTIFGISERSHPEVVKRLWDMPKMEAREEAKIFYKTEYWDRIHGDNLPNRIDIFMFDTAVNTGVSQTMWLCDEGLDSVFDCFINRIKHYVAIAQYRNNIKYLRGWLNRVIDLWEYIK
jgi:hypothetical protein